ncbi:MAG: glycerol-3-phosphate acyltransferase [Rhodospirillaceae bacterium TMED8]|nr:glycerol-3-phosphate acyltransferase [Magnetovibrio sp.]OUT51237.1 MAG: glycerol-3-phosphate acyltransferase [Rhodospirillaceae bacterium TMED8]|tara:strand:- start:2988 stop:4001 length:1014 start_codon:yes stop_codon:yes gene_type:complete
MDQINIIGAGAWGTALAQVAAEAGRRVAIWAREPDVVKSVNKSHENSIFLPGFTLHNSIRATASLARAADADALLLAVPAQFLRITTEALASHLNKQTAIVICTKGIELSSGALMNEVVKALMPEQPLAILSGPTFAIEVAQNLPTAVTLACDDSVLGSRLCAALGTPRFRTYHSKDVIGAEIGGAVKNVLAIACGIVEGKRLGDNARAAIITRGLVEMAKLCVAKGGNPETLMGLCGIGDLTLTCNAMQSRNFSLGVALGRGRSLDDVLSERTSVSEGVDTASAVTTLADALDIEMPICTAVNAIVGDGAQIDEIIKMLLSRPIGAESPFTGIQQN